MINCEKRQPETGNRHRQPETSNRHRKPETQLNLMPAKTNFATELKKRRLQKGWTQQQMANKTGIARHNLGAYEEGRAEPRLGNFFKICEVFGILIFKN